jgi:hypothetical protein
VTRVPPEENVESHPAGPGPRERESAAGLPRYPDTEDDTGAEPDRRSAAGAPRWIRVLGIVIAILVVLTLVALHLSGAIGPGVHQ